MEENDKSCSIYSHQTSKASKNSLFVGIYIRHSLLIYKLFELQWIGRLWFRQHSRLRRFWPNLMLRAVLVYGSISYVVLKYMSPYCTGTLPNSQIVVVTRLSKNSQHGIGELKNELVLLMKLWHKNLVMS